MRDETAAAHPVAPLSIYLYHYIVTVCIVQYIQPSAPSLLVSKRPKSLIKDGPVAKSLIKDRFWHVHNFIISSFTPKQLRPMCSPSSQALWAKRGHLSQQRFLTQVLEHKTVACFSEFFFSENTRMCSTQHRQATQAPVVRGLNHIIDLITFHFD